MFIWSGDKPEAINKIAFTKDTDSEGRVCFVAEDVDLKGYDPSSFGIMLFLKCQDTGFVDYKTKVYGSLT